MSANPSFVGTVRTPCVQVLNGDGTNFKTVFTAGASGSRLDMLQATNSDASNAYVVQLAIQKGGADYVIGEVSVPAGAGTDGTHDAVNLLNDTDIAGLANTINVLFLETGCALRAKSKTAVSGVNTVNIVGSGGDY